MQPKTKITLVGNNKIVNYNDKTLFIKKRTSYNIEDIYKYLDDHLVDNYLKPIEITNKELIFPYIENTTLTNDEISKRLVLNLAIWQNKTTTYQEINLDEVKTFYEEKKKDINYLYAYYQDLVLQLESKVYYLPTEYLFLRNSSMINNQLRLTEELLEEWYSIVKTKERERLVYVHGKCSLNHFLPKDDGYFISLENAHLGLVTDDIEYLFRNSFSTIDLGTTYDLYQRKYPYSEEEKLLLFIKLSLPEKISIYPANLETNKKILLFYNKLATFKRFILEKKQKNKNGK